MTFFLNILLDFAFANAILFTLMVDTVYPMISIWLISRFHFLVMVVSSIVGSWFGKISVCTFFSFMFSECP